MTLVEEELEPFRSIASIVSGSRKRQLVKQKQFGNLRVESTEQMGCRIGFGHRLRKKHGFLEIIIRANMS